MNWWDIVKIKFTDGLPEDHDERMARSQIERIYGFSPYRLGALKALNDLRGDYNTRRLSDFLEFRKDLQIVITVYDRGYYYKSKHFLNFRIRLHVEFEKQHLRERGVVLFLSEDSTDKNEVLKYFKDWVEIYDKPNHLYKNIRAVNQLSQRSKELLSKYNPVNDIENILIQEPKIISGRVEDDIWEFELPPKNSYMDEINVDRAAIIQLSREL